MHAVIDVGDGMMTPANPGEVTRRAKRPDDGQAITIESCQQNININRGIVGRPNHHSAVLHCH